MAERAVSSDGRACRLEIPDKSHEKENDHLSVRYVIRL